MADRVPILGVCLGSQLLATALGSQVRKGLRQEIGWHRVFLESAALCDPLLSTSPPEFDTFHWHGDVYDLPPGAVRLAHSRNSVPYGADPRQDLELDRRVCR